MAKPKVQVPELPSFYSDPNLSGNIGLLSRLGQGLSSGNYFNPDDPSLGFLNPLVSLNPEATQRAVGFASRGVTDQYNLTKQDTINQLEANNQLTSSTTASALTNLDKSFMQDISDINTQFYLADVNRAMSNNASLFELGLNTTGNAANLGLSDQGQRNQFNLTNFDNQFAANLANSQASRGGLAGALTGALGGAGTGAAIGSIIPGVGTLAGAGVGAVLGGAAGGFGSPTTGSQLFQGGATAAGFAASKNGFNGFGFTPTSTFPNSGSTGAGMQEALIAAARNYPGFGGYGGIA